MLEYFKADTHKQKFEAMRELHRQGKLDEYDIRKNLLPAVTFCGKFQGGHAKTNIQEYHRLLILDIDKLPASEIIRVRDCLLSDSFVFSFWESPSQTGFKGLVCLHYETEPQDIHHAHTLAFAIIRQYFIDKYDFELDKSGSDTSRICYISYDPNLVIKDEVQPFIITDEEMAKLPVRKETSSTKRKGTHKNNVFVGNVSTRHYNSENRNNQQSRTEIRDIIRYLKRRRLSITEDYESWYRVAYAIANSFSYDLGQKYYLDLCRLDGDRHDEIASNEMLLYCYDNSHGDISFATIRYFAEQKGYKRGGSEGG